MNGKKSVLSVGGNDMTVDDVAEYFGMSDSEDSDWGELKEVNADDFLVAESKKETEKKRENIEETVVTNTFKVKKPVVNIPVNVVPELKKKSMSVSKKLEEFVATPTNIKVKNPQMTPEIWRERITDRQVVTASRLCSGNKAELLADTDYILVGVIIQKSGTKKTKNDTNFSTWMIGDLDCLDKAVRFMLFSEVHNTLWKEVEGTVVAILQPKLMKSNTPQSGKSFTVDIAGKVIVLGQSPDYGTCDGITKTGDKCSNVVNKTQCGICVFHIQQEYKSASARPGFINIMSEKLNSRKRVAPKQEWQVANKKAKNTAIMVNNTIGNAMSLAKLHKGGVTHAVVNRGLLDKDAIAILDEEEKADENKSKATLTEGDKRFMELLKKKGPGSYNVVKHIAEKSGQASVLAGNVIKKGQQFNTFRPIAAAGVTCQSTLKLIEERIIRRDDPQKYIDLGMAPVDLSKVSREVYKGEINKLNAAEMVKSHGGYEALRERIRLEHLKNAGQPKVIAVAKTMSKGPLSEEMLKLLHQGSANKHLADQKKDMEMDKKLDNMEKIEKMELKMSSIHEQSCFLYYCQQCKTKTLGNPTMCVIDGHTIDREKGSKRFFRCLKCKHRLMTLEKYPDEACFKCGASVYEKAGMFKGKEVTMEKVLIDGGEKRFINN